MFKQVLFAWVTLKVRSVKVQEGPDREQVMGLAVSLFSPATDGPGHTSTCDRTHTPSCNHSHRFSACYPHTHTHTNRCCPGIAGLSCVFILERRLLDSEAGLDGRKETEGRD